MHGNLESRTSLALVALDGRVRIEVAAPELLPLLSARFGAMLAGTAGGAFDAEYRILVSATEPRYALLRNTERAVACTDPAEFIEGLAQHLTVQMQKWRADLFFLHSGAVDWRGKACLLVAESGSGKSTTTLALLHHGFQYLSDELAPIALDSMQVWPYAHALVLKRQPPTPYLVSRDALYLGSKIFLPAPTLPGEVVLAPRPVCAVVLLERGKDHELPQLSRITPPEAAARLYVNALNARAHPNWGLDAAARIAEEVPCFVLVTADLAATCALVRSAVQQALT